MAALWLLSDNEKRQLIRTIGWDNYSNMKEWEGVVIDIGPKDMTINFCVRKKGIVPSWDVIRISRDGNYFKGMPYSPEIFTEIDKGNIPYIPSGLFNVVIAECKNIDGWGNSRVIYEHK